uniref:Non-specific serine/threonine protein kinase n=1 Tax=Bursaphelenchus xylophilus TaxID=6326 RepID=A0A1I7SGS6_BURXY
VEDIDKMTVRPFGTEIAPKVAQLFHFPTEVLSFCFPTDDSQEPLSAALNEVRLHLQRVGLYDPQNVLELEQVNMDALSLKEPDLNVAKRSERQKEREKEARIRKRLEYEMQRQNPQNAAANVEDYPAELHIDESDANLKKAVCTVQMFERNRGHAVQKRLVSQRYFDAQCKTKKKVNCTVQKYGFLCTVRGKEPKQQPLHSLNASFIKKDSTVETKTLRFEHPEKLFIYLQTAIQLALESISCSLDFWDVAFVLLENEDKEVEITSDFFPDRKYHVALVPTNYKVIRNKDLLLVKNADQKVVWGLTQRLNQLFWTNGKEPEEEWKVKDTTVTLSYSIFDEFHRREYKDPQKLKVKCNTSLLDVMINGFKQAGVSKPQLLEPSGIIKRNGAKFVKVSYKTNVEKEAQYEAVLYISNSIEQAQLTLYNSERLASRIILFPCYAHDLIDRNTVIRHLVGENLDISTLAPHEGVKYGFVAREIELQPVGKGFGRKIRKIKISNLECRQSGKRRLGKLKSIIFLRCKCRN